MATLKQLMDKQSPESRRRIIKKAERLRQTVINKKLELPITKTISNFD